MPFQKRFVSDYLDPLQVASEFATLASAFPGLCRLESLPFLTHGYYGANVAAHGRHHMHVLRITSNVSATSKPGVLLFRSPHAREWINAMAVVETARQFLENYRPADSDPEVQEMVQILGAVEILIVPEGNPDGARLTFFDSGQRYWRKNLRPPVAGATCSGVDCNRNYPRYFGEAGSSSDPCTEIYHGPSAFSEPESANIAYLLENNRNIIFAIDSHSSGQALYRPHPTGGTYVSSLPVTPQDHAIFLALESAMNGRISMVQGVSYSTGTTSNHAGASDEYCLFQQRVFCFDLECGLEFQPSQQNAVLAAMEVAEAVKALAAIAAAGNEVVDISNLMQQRAALPSSPVQAPVEAPTDRRWVPASPPPAKERRYLVECKSKTNYPVKEILGLHSQGYDLEDTPSSDSWRMIVSAQERKRLEEQGFQLRLLKDLGSKEE